MTASSRRPLEGVVVLDLSQYAAGPYCTMLMADAGARVIKVEPPERGDPYRHEGPTLAGENGSSTGGFFVRFNRSKDNKTLYAISLGWPTGNQMVITSLKSGSFNVSTITGVTLVGGDACTYTQDSTGLKVTLPSTATSDANGCAVKISFSGTIPAVQ